MKCPCCKTLLKTGFEMKDNHFVAWCGNGKCVSYKANEGATGKTADEAKQNLIKLLEAKPDWKNEN